tara:strand:+ start:1125 stop:1679 length:555 start_codon:yes stop_codon:yes gene_type:complete
MIYNEITKNEEGEREVKVFTDEKKRCIVKLVNVECIEVDPQHMYIKISGEDNQAKISEFDNSNINEASENCEKWFGRKIPGPTIEKAYHTDSFDRFSLELIAETKAFNHKNEPLPLEDIKPGSKCSVFVEFSEICFSRKNFAPIWKIVQVKIHEEEKPPPPPEPETPEIEAYPEECMFEDEDSK